eukprot:TRINITY_DN61703_c0_g2_i2.p2 TRINITY_DN61703_c0_g2~~TRINITY_DN61703_c0_g2_i2.p2  ORF type:complete len:384 (+),score=57.12 TRINITY_DN61703_c0_g2_i2:90-1154(+)
MNKRWKDLKESLEEKEKECTTYRAMANQSKVEAAETKRQLDKGHKECEKWKVEYENMRNEAASREHDLIDLRTRVKEAAQKDEIEMCRMREVSEAAQSESMRWRMVVEQERTVMQGLREALDKEQLENHEAKIRAQRLDAHIGDLQKHLEDAHKENDQLRQLMTEQEKIIAGKDPDRDNSYRQAQVEKSALMAEIHTLRERLQAFQHDARLLEDQRCEITLLKEENERLKTSLQTAEEHAQDDNAELTQHIEELQKKNDRLESERTSGGLPSESKMLEDPDWQLIRIAEQQEEIQRLRQSEKEKETWIMEMQRRPPKQTEMQLHSEIQRLRAREQESARELEELRSLLQLGVRV